MKQREYKKALPGDTVRVIYHHKDKNYEVFGKVSSINRKANKHHYNVIPSNPKALPYPIKGVNLIGTFEVEKNIGGGL